MRASRKSSAEPPLRLWTLRADTLFDGRHDRPRREQTIIVEAGRIAGVANGDPGLPDDTQTYHAAIVAPGFIDLQINGAGDVLFNDTPTVGALQAILAAARKGGTAYALPTFISAPGQAYRRALDVVEEAVAQQRVAGLLGVHLEGPFLNKERPGIHPADAIRAMDGDDLAVLAAADRATRLITLAPERQPPKTIARLAEAGWRVFAGHSLASFETIQKAEQEGLAGATHLFNAMAPITGREPGLVGAVLGSSSLAAGIIADGHHVHRANLALAAARLGDRRLCLVSDAMATLFGTGDSFTLAGTAITLRHGRLTDAQGRLAGAQLTQDAAVRLMVNEVGTPLASALRMAATAPAIAIGLDDQLGYVKQGFRAGLTMLNEALACTGVVVDGAHSVTAA